MYGVVYNSIRILLCISTPITAMTTHTLITHKPHTTTTHTNRHHYTTFTTTTHTLVRSTLFNTSTTVVFSVSLRNRSPRIMYPATARSSYPTAPRPAHRKRSLGVMKPCLPANTLDTCCKGVGGGDVVGGGVWLGGVWCWDVLYGSMHRIPGVHNSNKYTHNRYKKHWYKHQHTHPHTHTPVVVVAVHASLQPFSLHSLVQ